MHISEVCGALLKHSHVLFGEKKNRLMCMDQRIYAEEKMWCQSCCVRVDVVLDYNNGGFGGGGVHKPSLRAERGGHGVSIICNLGFWSLSFLIQTLAICLLDISSVRRIACSCGVMCAHPGTLVK